MTGGTTITTSSDATLWTNNFAPLLAANMWEDANLEYSCLVLHVGLHYAHATQNATWLGQVKSMLDAFIASGTGAAIYNGATQWDNSSTRFYRMHFLYFCSRHLVLARQYGNTSYIPATLAQVVMDAIEIIWKSGKAWVWDRNDFYSMKERWNWRMQFTPVTSSPSSYHAIVTEEDLYCFAVASDLRHYEKMTGVSFNAAETVVLNEMLPACLRTYTERVEFLDNTDRWLFQKGFWTDHPDFAYCGHTQKTNGVALVGERKRANIVDDTSHFHRTPIWLLSHRGAYSPESNEYRYYTRLYEGFDKQFFEKLYIPECDTFAAPRVANYVDGWNGIYRWSYNIANHGYGPYGLFQTLVNGWWTFLKNPKAKGIYACLANLFPFPDDVLTLALDPNDSTYVAARLANKALYDDGIFELHCRLSQKMPYYTNP